jgi:hypothetical protein
MVDHVPTAAWACIGRRHVVVQPSAAVMHAYGWMVNPDNRGIQECLCLHRAALAAVVALGALQPPVTVVLLVGVTARLLPGAA